MRLLKNIKKTVQGAKDMGKAYTQMLDVIPKGITQAGKIVDNLKNQSSEGLQNLGNAYADAIKDTTPTTTPTPGYLGDVMKGYASALLGNTPAASIIESAKNINDKAVDNSSSSPSTPEAPTSEKELTWDEYFAKEEERVNAYNEYLKNYAEETKTAEYERAEKEYQRDAIDAEAEYRRNIATYGSQAEALAKMGLNGSGYSDYLQGNAYSQLRSDKNGAAVERGDAMALADENYRNALLAAEQNKLSSASELNKQKLEHSEEQKAEKKEGYQTLVGLAESGYSIDMLKSYANASGIEFSDDEWNEIGGITSKYTNNSRADFLTEAISSAGTFEIGELKKIAAERGINVDDASWSIIENAIKKAEDDEIDEKTSQFIANILSAEKGVDSYDYETLKAYMEQNGISTEEGTISGDILSSHKTARMRKREEEKKKQREERDAIFEKLGIPEFLRK